MIHVQDMTVRRDVFSNAAWLAGVVFVHALVFVILLNTWVKPQPPAMTPAIVGVLVMGNASGAQPASAQTSAEIPRQNRILSQAVAPAAASSGSHVHKQLSPDAVQLQPEKASAASTSDAVQSGSAGNASQLAGSGANADSVVLPRSEAAHLNNPKPVYPAISRRIGEQGNVRLAVYIRADGRVGDVRLQQSSGHVRLDQSAMEAVRQWQYVPAHRAGVPVDYWYVQTVIFSLKP